MQARLDLYTYQNNREHLAETNRSKLQGLKKKFILSAEKLLQDLKALEPVFPKAAPIPESFPSLLFTWVCTHPGKSLLLLALAFFLDHSPSHTHWRHYLCGQCSL